jgi:glutaredoxin
MKLVVRLFFRTLRAILGPFLLLGDRLTRPKGIVRPEHAQQAVDARTRALALYHFPTCPFCLKTRRTVRRLSLDIELRDARNDDAHRAALVAGGGKPQVPCLQITDAGGQLSWLYESDAINAYLDREFGTA